MLDSFDEVYLTNGAEPAKLEAEQQHQPLLMAEVAAACQHLAYNCGGGCRSAHTYAEIHALRCHVSAVYQCNASIGFLQGEDNECVH